MATTADERRDEEPLHELTGFQRDCLAAASKFDEDPSGQEIKELLEQYYEKTINHGRLYPNLDTLMHKGLIEKGQLDRRTNYYTITEDGRERLRSNGEWQTEDL